MKKSKKNREVKKLKSKEQINTRKIKKLSKEISMLRTTSLKARKFRFGILQRITQQSKPKTMV